MSLLVAFPESSGGRIRSSPQPTSSYITSGMNNRLVGGRGSVTPHSIDMLNQSITIKAIPYTGDSYLSFIYPGSQFIHIPVSGI
jgi:hypothetical protein